MISARRRSMAALAIKLLLMGLSDTKKRARGPLLFLGGSKIVNLKAAIDDLYRQCP